MIRHLPFVVVVVAAFGIGAVVSVFCAIKIARAIGMVVLP